MKIKVSLLAFGFIACTAGADLKVCPEAVLKDPVHQRALSFLQSIAGTFQLGRCTVELHFCAGTSDAVGDGDSIVGDLLVTGPHGDSAYVPLDFSMTSTPRTHRILLTGRRMVHYESIEHVRDPVNGRTENYRLEIVKTEDLQRVESLDLGVYTSKQGDSRWFNCSR